MANTRNHAAADTHKVMGVYAPPPRPTFHAAVLVATALSLIFLAGLWTYRLLT